MKVYPHPLKFRVMREGHQFIIEQECGSAGWWPVGEFDSLERAKMAIESVRAKEKDQDERVQVWP